MAKRHIAIVGCGTVGTALGQLLAQAGHVIVGVSARHKESAEKAARKVGTKRCSEIPWDITVGAQVVFITTPDDAIEKTCQDISDKNGFDNAAVVLHCSGALSSEILASARTCHASVASLHPLQSFASVEQAVHLVPGSYCAIEGDPPALATARQMVGDLGGIVMEIKKGAKTLYHAAAVVASNYLVTLVHVAQALNKNVGLSPHVSFKALQPLIKGTLKNIEARGIPDALTGPICRGDIATVQAHLASMKREAPELLDAYRALGRLTVGLARAKGTLSPERADRMEALLKNRK
jgi:predicted short-subunit dehydrogenase-like oxidoreductase (DUF2520 family)